jgi:hypothetical protein
MGNAGPHRAKVTSDFLKESNSDFYPLGSIKGKISESEFGSDEESVNGLPDIAYHVGRRFRGMGTAAAEAHTLLWQEITSTHTFATIHVLSLDSFSMWQYAGVSAHRKGELVRP